MAVRLPTAIVLAIALTGCDNWSDRRVAESERRGDIVSHAIQAYRVKTGKYPFKLEDLQPDFLREVPPPTAGYKEWEYSVIDDGTNYSLHVVGSERDPILDRTSDGHWNYIK